MRYSDMIGRHLRSIRESKGYSQEYMAEMLDTCQSSYANLESGKSTLSVDRLLRICEILGVDVHDLIDKTGPKAEGQKGGKAEAPQPSQRKEDLPPETKTMYEQLITSLRDEVSFLRSLVRDHRTP